MAQNTPGSENPLLLASEDISEANFFSSFAALKALFADPLSPKQLSRVLHNKLNYNMLQHILHRLGPENMLSQNVQKKDTKNFLSKLDI